MHGYTTPQISKCKAHDDPDPLWTTGWMFVYTIQPDVKPVWQPVVSCKQGITGLHKWNAKRSLH